MKSYFYSDSERKAIKEDLLTSRAIDWANEFINPKQPRERWQKNPRLTSTQLRNFYHEVKYIQEICKSTQNNPQKKFSEIRPLVKMLKSKVAYSCPNTGRDRKVPIEFKQFIDNLVDNVHDLKDFEAFVMCFESVVGFFYGQGGR